MLKRLRKFLRWRPTEDEIERMYERIAGKRHDPEMAARGGDTELIPFTFPISATRYPVAETTELTVSGAVQLITDYLDERRMKAMG